MAEHAQHPKVADVEQAARDSNVPVTDRSSAAVLTSNTIAESLALESIDLEKVLEMGTPLLASGGEVMCLQIRLACSVACLSFWTLLLQKVAMCCACLSSCCLSPLQQWLQRACME
jgi:hypothetical protein